MPSRVASVSPGFSLVPIDIPIHFLGLHRGVSLLQTYIFYHWIMVYLAGAVAGEH